MHKSVQKMAPKDIKVVLTAPQNRMYSCWIGGATVSALKAFSRLWGTKKDMEEEGTRILLKRDI